MRAPSVTPMPTLSRPTYMEICEPTMMRLSSSRPKWSLPNHAPGCGARYFSSWARTSNGSWGRTPGNT